MRLPQKENTAVPLLQKQLDEVDKGIENMVNAMQQGILTKSTKKRFDELEEQKEKLDLTDDYSKRRLVDSFVNSVYLYDDKAIVSFNTREGASTLPLLNKFASDCGALGEPNWINPNSHGGSDLFVFYPGKPVFGLVVPTLN